MLRLAAVVALTALLHFYASSQCPPTINGSINYTGGINFSTFRTYVHLSSQAEIDAFPSLYPTCTSVPSLLIGDPDMDTDITNVNGLSQLVNMGDVIVMRTSMTNLTGIDIGSKDLHAIANGQLQTLNGLASDLEIGNFFIAVNPLLTSLGTQTFTSTKFVQIVTNAMLPNLIGLENLTKAELVSVSQISLLQNLNGLQNLDSVDIALTIRNCQNLTSLTGLEGLRNIEGTLNISANGALTDISAIENLTRVGGNVVITYNAMLATCDNSFICQFISDGFYADIQANLGSCETIDSVLEACNITLDCPYDLEINSQAALDSFRIDYPNCTRINGSVKILDSDISELSALDRLKHIGYKLILENNQHLTSLAGLNNVDFVGDELNIKNNDLLSNLAGLENLSNLRVVFITENDLLSICNVSSLCRYLNNLPINFSYFFNANADGCNGSQVNSPCNCLNSVSVTQGDGIYWAADMISTSDNLRVNNYASYSAPNVIVQPSFEVTSGKVFEIKQDGCVP